MKNNVVLSILLLIMFILSGVHKIGTFDKTVESLKQKTSLGFTDSFHNLIIAAVILLETIAPVIIIYYFMSGKYKTTAYYSNLSLIGFTVLATLLYHPPDFSNYYKSRPFWTNVSLIGGLLLLSKQIKTT
jgi:uncharacterized membrane protein YphA (DoxX/SURF4 family)